MRSGLRRRLSRQYAGDLLAGKRDACGRSDRPFERDRLQGERHFLPRSVGPGAGTGRITGRAGISEAAERSLRRFARSGCVLFVEDVGVVVFFKFERPCFVRFKQVDVHARFVVSYVQFFEIIVVSGVDFGESVVRDLHGRYLRAA